MVVVVKVVNAVETLGRGLSSLLVLPIAQSSFTPRSLNLLGSTALPEDNRYETKFGRHCGWAQKASPKAGVSEVRRMPRPVVSTHEGGLISNAIAKS